MELWRDGQGGENGLERQRGKEKEKEGTKEDLCGNNPPAGSQKQEGPGTEQPLSPDCSDKREVTSERSPLQREETNTQEEGGRFSKQKRQLGGKESPSLRSKRGGLTGKMVRQVEEPQGRGPFFFVGGANGAEIVTRYCQSKGWQRIYDKHRVDFKLKWCETKSPATYNNFREGEQLVYQIPNNKVLTTKIGILNSLREYERVGSKIKHGKHRRLKMEDFIPTTFRMDVSEEREAFFSQQEEEGQRQETQTQEETCRGVSSSEAHMWICKPTGLNQGKGISLLKSQEDVAALRLKLRRMEDSLVSGRPHQRRAQAYIVQHYIQNPLLLKGRKFDVRSYLLIACTAPYMVFFRHGYVRLTCDVYNPSSKNLSAHLTNQYMQKKSPLYHLLKEDTVWSMEAFNNYINDKFQVARGLPRDWVLGAFAKRMQQIMTQCFFAVKSKLDCRLGFFDLIGCDFMIDEDFKVWLLEMNCNPALHTNCEVLKEVIPSTVAETMDLTLEIFNKRRLRNRILPLAAQREFVLLHDGALTPGPSQANGNRNANRVLPKDHQQEPNN